MKLAFERRLICPVCNTEREIPRLEIPRARGAMTALGVAVGAGVIVSLFLATNLSAWFGAILGILFFLGFEVYYSAKFRRELECPVCRFDPLLYRRKPEEAKERCRKGLKMREEVFLARWRALRAKPRSDSY